MIYSNIIFDTKFDANYFDGKWFMHYTLIQSRKNLDGIKEQREITFTNTSERNYEQAYYELMNSAISELSQYDYDFFKMPNSAFISMKERIEDGKTKDNQIAKN